MAEAKAKPVYVLHGADGFLRDAYRREIVSNLLGEADPQLCICEFDATVELVEVLDELRTAPFLAPLRVVVVSDADAFVSAHRDKLERYLSSPAPTGALVLVVSSWRSDTRLAKLVKRIGQTYDCSAPKEKDLPAWLNKAFGKRGKKVAPDAAALLAEWVGEDLGALNSEVEKLATYVGDRQSVSARDVSELVAATSGPAAFALSNAITTGDLPRALKALEGMLRRRGEEFRTLGMIGWHLRRALAAQQQIESGARPDAALRSARVFYDKPGFLTMLRRRGLRGLRQDFRRLIRCDLAMKTGTQPGAAMQDLVVALCT